MSAGGELWFWQGQSVRPQSGETGEVVFRIIAFNADKIVTRNCWLQAFPGSLRVKLQIEDKFSGNYRGTHKAGY